MLLRDSNAPAWLFSFVDLAFLLLLAMTQLAGQENAPSLGEIVLPRLDTESSAELPIGAAARWQLRVHPPDPDGSSPFELFRAGRGDAAPAARIDRDTLRTRLARLRAAGVEKPLLAPHRDSRSEDFLEAAELLEDLWPQRRRATISPAWAQR